jgi:hypothetical protein
MGDVIPLQVFLIKLLHSDSKKIKRTSYGRKRYSMQATLGDTPRGQTDTDDNIQHNNTST